MSPVFPARRSAKGKQLLVNTVDDKRTFCRDCPQQRMLGEHLADQDRQTPPSRLDIQRRRWTGFSQLGTSKSHSMRGKYLEGENHSEAIELVCLEAVD